MLLPFYTLKYLVFSRKKRIFSKKRHFYHYFLVLFPNNMYFCDEFVKIHF